MHTKQIVLGQRKETIRASRKLVGRLLVGRLDEETGEIIPTRKYKRKIIKLN